MILWICIWVMPIFFPLFPKLYAVVVLGIFWLHCLDSFRAMGAGDGGLSVTCC